MSKPQASTSSTMYQPSEHALREIVLDYLIHCACTNTARVFAAESAIHVRASEIRDDLRLRGDADALPDSDDAGDAMAVEEELGADAVDNDSTMDDDDDDDEESESDMGADVSVSADVLEAANLRKDIRIHILSGRVGLAQSLLRAYFPKVLGDEDDHSRTHHEGTRTPLPALPRTPTPHDRVPYKSQTSINPIHISLNLRILDFIEAARTVPLPFSGDTLQPTSDESESGEPMSGTGTHTPIYERSSDAFSAHQTSLLHRAQRLYATVESLRDSKDREVYRKELNGVGGLLAYPVPEKSPTAHYMRQERREALADQVNSAILFHLHQPATSHLELYVRQTATTFSVMHDNGFTLPSEYPVDHAMLPKDFLPEQQFEPSVAPGGAPAKPANGGASKEKKEGDVAPYFDFHDFVEVKV